MKVFNLDDVYSKLGISCGKHANEVIVVGNRVVVVERTGRAKLEDVKKLIETVNRSVNDKRLQSELLRGLQLKV